MSDKHALVCVIMGSSSDYGIIKKCLATLDEFDVPYTVNVCSAHRDPVRLQTIIQEAEKSGIICFICAAGMAAHLPGVTAAFTTRPVIGVPLSGGIIGAWDALLAIAQMPPGVPVLTVGVDSVVNAAISAVQLIAICDKNYADKLIDYKIRQTEKNRLQNAEIQKETNNY